MRMQDLVIRDFGTTRRVALIASLVCLGVSWSALVTAETALSFTPGPPETRPYACTANPENLAKCAETWLQLVRNGKSSKSVGAYWEAAEFQGFVEGVSH